MTMPSGSFRIALIRSHLRPQKRKSAWSISMENWSWIMAHNPSMDLRMSVLPQTIWIASTLEISANITAPSMHPAEASKEQAAHRCSCVSADLLLRFQSYVNCQGTWNCFLHAEAVLPENPPALW